MSAASVATEYLREFAKHYLKYLAFDDEAERQMREEKISLVDVHNALKTGVVVDGDKESAEGATWVIVGETCEEEELTITLEVYVHQNDMCVKRVTRIKRA
jgi:hypothetical protein